MKINLLVLFGGKSTEHEVSIISAIQAIENINKDKYNIIPVYIDKKGDFYYHNQLLFDSNNFKNINNLISQCEKVCIIKNDNKTFLQTIKKSIFKNDIISEIDVAFPIVHGTNVEDGNLQGYLHTLNIPYVGCDNLTSAIGMDKYVMKQFLKIENIPVIDGYRFYIKDYDSINDLINDIEQKIEYPIIVKPINLGSSIGISKADNKIKLQNALDLAFNFCESIIVEKAIVEMREFNCAILGNRFECITSMVEEPFGNDEILSFSDKYLSGSKNKSGSKISNVNIGSKSGMASLQRKIPADIDEQLEKEIKNIATSVFKLLNCNGVCRIDFIYDNKDKKLYVNEINTIPGSLSFYLFDKMSISYKDLIDKLIKLAIDRFRKDNNLQYSFDSQLF